MSVPNRANHPNRRPDIFQGPAHERAELITRRRSGGIKGKVIVHADDGRHEGTHATPVYGHKTGEEHGMLLHNADSSWNGKPVYLPNSKVHEVHDRPISKDD